MVILHNLYNAHQICVDIPTPQRIQTAHLQHSPVQRRRKLHIYHKPHTNLNQPQHQFEFQLQIRQRESFPHRKVYGKKFHRRHLFVRRLQYGLQFGDIVRVRCWYNGNE